MKSVLRSAGFIWLISFAVALSIGLSSIVVQPAKADNLYGRIQGTVTDPGGAALAGLKLTATNVGTNISFTTETNSVGSFAFLNLPIGTYKVAASASGFRTFTATGISLVVDQVYVLDIKMELGQISEMVTVEANPVEVNTTSAQLGTVVDANQIANIPLLNRNWVNLQQTQPGVVAAADARGDFSTNGSETQQNSYLINGTDTNDLPLNTPLIIPSPDAIEEFRMVTNVINPEYGRNSGAVINAITKSGTNEFHGDAFNFYRDTFLNARNFFAKKPQVFHQNQFGGTLGGPIWKNHTFIFFSYQGTRNRAPGSGGNVRVFSPAEASGNFSADLSKLSASDTSPFPLFGNAESGCPVGGAPCAAGTSYVRLFDSVPTAADAGMIPSADINPLSAKLQSQFVPLPNSPGNRFEFSPVNPGSTNQYIGRVDQHLGSKDPLWGEWFYSHNLTRQELPFTGASLPGFGSKSETTLNQGTVSWTHIFNDHMLNELRGGYTRLNFVAVFPQTPVLPNSFCGSNSSYVGGSGNICFNISPQDPSGAGLPRMTVQGLFTLGFSNNGPQPRIDQTYQTTDNFSLTHGHHTMKTGFDMRRFQVFNPFFAANNGFYNFQNSNAPFGSGISGLDFLLGIPINYTQGSGAIIDARNQEYYSYFQDEFKVRPNLTITYGTGWQIDTPFFNKFAQGHSLISFNPTQQSTLFASAPTGVVWQGDPGVHASGRTHWHDFGPRFGFAYSPDWGGRFTGGPGKTSIRGGYGIYFNRSEEEQTLQTLTAPPFSITSIGAAAPGFANPYADIKTGATVTNPFPFVPPSPSPNLDFTPFEPIYNGIAFQDAATVSPMAENFNLTLERQLPSSSILSIGYVGAVAHHLTRGVPANVPTLASIQAYCAVPANAGNCGPGADFALWLAAPQLFQYNSLTYGPIDDITTTGNSRYSSMQVSWNKRMAHGLQTLVAYTYSHSIDNTSGFEASSFGGAGFGAGGFERAANPYCPRCDYGNSIFDARHRLAISYVYNIPSIRKVSFFQRAPSRIFEGWMVSGVTTFQSGFPLDIVDNNFASGFCMPQVSDFACPDVPNITGTVQYGNPRSFAPLVPSNEGGGCSPQPCTPPTVSNAWFNPASFSQQGTGTNGNVGRNSLRGPGINNFDVGLYKNTSITERTSLQLRIEFYNVFNHTQFTSANGGIDNGFGDGASFGEVFSAAAPRLIQLAAKFIF
jgi:carboxypeptidase family protein